MFYKVYMNNDIRLTLSFLTERPHVYMGKPASNLLNGKLLVAICQVDKMFKLI